MDYFEISYDWKTYPDRWHLDDPIDEDGNEIESYMLPRRGRYTGGKLSKVKVNMEIAGSKLDFSFGSFNLILVKKNVADIIESLGGGIQRFPITLEPCEESGYEVIFVLESPKGCIDLSKAEEFEFFEKDDQRVKMPYGGIPTRKKGMLYKIYDLFLIKNKIPKLNIFSPFEYPCIVVSEKLKNEFELNGVTGIKYRKVT